MKRGYETTEFWLTMGTVATTFYGMLSGALPAKWALIATAAVVASYSISRAFVKVKIE